MVTRLDNAKSRLAQGYSVRVAEPMTMATDYALALESVALGVALLMSGRRERQRGRLFWGAAFVTTALAAACGGTAHGFAAALEPLTRTILWKGVLYSVGVTSYCMLTAAALTAARSMRLRAVLLGTAPVLLLGYAVWMVAHDAFIWAIVDYAPVLVALVVLHAVLAWRWRSPASPWILAGVFASVAGAAVQALEWAPHPFFDHNALYHVIQMLGMVLFYVGGRELEDLG